MRRITGDGVELAVLDEGEGPAVLLLHGFPDSAQLVASSGPDANRRGFPGRCTRPARLRRLRQAGRRRRLPGRHERRRPGRGARRARASSRRTSSATTGAPASPGRSRCMAAGARERAGSWCSRRPPGALRPPQPRAAREVLVHAALPVPGGRGDPAPERLGAAARVDGDATRSSTRRSSACEPGALTAASTGTARTCIRAASSQRRPAAAQRHGRHARPLEHRRPLPARGGHEGVGRVRRRQLALRAHRGRGPLDAARRARARQRAAA